jgi:arylsulfatase I/J
MAYVAFHAAHEPLQVPDATLAKFAWIEDETRRLYMAMVNEMDSHLGRIVDALKVKGMWDNSLFLAFADNGGPLNTCSNYPLRGGKMGNFEGGTRGAAVLSGGFVPQARRGTVATGFVAIEDWYSTICGLAGVDPDDKAARSAGLPPIDSLDLWPYLSGVAPTSPRTEIWKAAPSVSYREGVAVMQVLTNASTGLQLIIDDVGPDCWSGPHSPNASATCCGKVVHCGRPGNKSGKQGCLFNVVDDPGQHTDLAEAMPEVALALYKRLQEVNATAFQPDRGSFDKNACDVYQTKWRGFYGPWLPSPW